MKLNKETSFIDSLSSLAGAFGNNEGQSRPCNALANKMVVDDRPGQQPGRKQFASGAANLTQLNLVGLTVCSTYRIIIRGLLPPRRRPGSRSNPGISNMTTYSPVVITRGFKVDHRFPSYRDLSLPTGSKIADASGGNLGGDEREVKLPHEHFASSREEVRLS